MVNDSIADLLTRIRNAQKARHKTVVVPASKVSSSILDVLKREGYIGSIENVTGAPSASGPKDAVGRPQYKIYLKYDRFGFPAIKQLSRKSTPGLRVYSRKRELPVVNSGLGVAIISTSQGILTDKEARKLGIGGELLATVF
jgi:small subunit ribosomal protein S8